MSKKQGSKALSADLLEACVAALKRAKESGSTEYPMTLASLLAEAGQPSALAASVAESRAARKVMAIAAKTTVKPAHAQRALAVLLDDAQLLVTHPELLKRLLEHARTPSNQLFSIADLAAQLYSPNQGAFKKHWVIPARTGNLPAGVGSLMTNTARKLFLLGDVLSATALSPEQTAEPATLPPPSRPNKERLLEAFDKLDVEGGHRNYVTLFDLRRSLPDVSRDSFDAALNQLRREWVITLDPAEGRHERLPEEVLQAGIREESALLVYAARRDS